MPFLDAAIRDLVSAFDALSRFPRYKRLLARNEDQHISVDWYRLLNVLITLIKCKGVVWTRRGVVFRPTVLRSTDSILNGLQKD